ncbi:hypothetical protein BGZ96_003852 [Linnemannia gamsii]|uniref:F-box domain-containing protein n=1 Tax=Linnemannia gamsii TaxID=64522 RepID=A0ABQ7JIS3_9FUNG|nr:hypothetical protein BGZ96_003852 [Linnemannia gamsii]
MKSALDRFKDLPEIILLLAARLPPKDLHAFRLTSRLFHIICQSVFFSDFRLHNRWNSESLQQLASYAYALFSLNTGEGCIPLSLYYQNTVCFLRGSSSAVSFPQPTLSQRPVSILPRETLGALCDASCFATQLFHVVHQSPCLAILDLGRVIINTDIGLTLLTRVLSTIGNLQSLKLWVYSDHINPQIILKALVYSFPGLLKSFSLLYAPNCRALKPEAWDKKSTKLNETVSQQLGPTIKRTEPLMRMSDWNLIVTGNEYISAEVLLPLFKLFPELTSMDVPAIDNKDTNYLSSIAFRILEACPRLKHLSKWDIQADEEGRMMFAFLEQMKENTLESLQFLQYTEELQSLVWGLDYHNKSVKSIILNECQSMSATSIAWIFFQCPALEVFKISINYDSEFEIPRDVLVRQEWASTKFKELKLFVQLDEEVLEPSYPMSDWTNGMERFCRQIGALTQLRVLDLKVAVEKDSRNRDGDYITYKDKTFPGLLTLEDRGKGCLGWLQLLSGLKDLEELHGSFNLDVMLGGFEFGQEEADWVVEHWPKLKFIEFFTLPEGTPISYSQPLLSMITRLPGLKLASFYIDVHYPWQ